MIQSLAANWEASHAALYITTSDGTLEKLVSHALEIDPLISAVDPNAASDGVSIQNAGKRVVQMRGEEGPLTKTIKRVGLECVASAAFPLGTPNRRIGLLLLLFLAGRLLAEPFRIGAPGPGSVRAVSRAPRPLRSPWRFWES